MTEPSSEISRFVGTVLPGSKVWNEMEIGGAPDTVTFSRRALRSGLWSDNQPMREFWLQGPDGSERRCVAPTDFGVREGHEVGVFEIAGKDRIRAIGNKATGDVYWESKWRGCRWSVAAVALLLLSASATGAAFWQYIALLLATAILVRVAHGYTSFRRIRRNVIDTAGAYVTETAGSG